MRYPSCPATRESGLLGPFWTHVSDRTTSSPLRAKSPRITPLASHYHLHRSPRLPWLPATPLLDRLDLYLPGTFATHPFSLPPLAVTSSDTHSPHSRPSIPDVTPILSPPLFPRPLSLHQTPALEYVVVCANVYLYLIILIDPKRTNSEHEIFTNTGEIHEVLNFRTVSAGMYGDPIICWIVCTCPTNEVSGDVRLGPRRQLPSVRIWLAHRVC